MTGYYDFGEFSIGDFSPVNIKPPEKPLDEMSESMLRGYIVQLRGLCRLERMWQKSMDIQDDSRLIRLAEMYTEAQQYYAEYNPDFKRRINSSDYVPVLRLNGKKW